MNPQEVGDLLRFCSSLDPWLKATSPEEGAVMVAGWGLMLEAMPPDVAMKAAREHYQHGDSRTITPGDLLDAWAAVRRADQKSTGDEVQAKSIQQALDAGEGIGSVVFGSGAQYLADMMAAVARGEEPESVVRPAGVRVLNLSPEAGARERQCAFPDVCVCTHTECRAGWLDEYTTRTNALGRTYPAAQRCPRCEEGLVMAQEKGIARKPRRAPAGRR